jgi:hypothetical protein
MDVMTARLAPSVDALTRELDGEILLLDLKSSHYFGLAGSGARIWQLVEAGQTGGDIVLALAQEFDADEALIRAEVTGFLDDLVARGLLVAAPDAQ